MKVTMETKLENVEDWMTGEIVGGNVSINLYEPDVDNWWDFFATLQRLLDMLDVPNVLEGLAQITIEQDARMDYLGETVRRKKKDFIGSAHKLLGAIEKGEKAFGKKMKKKTKKKK